MKHEFTVEAALVPEGRLLMDVAQALAVLSRPPESLVWTASADEAAVRIWLSIETDAANSGEIMKSLRGLPGVTSVSDCGPGAETLRKLYASASKQ